jgi:hypothetical protein
VNDVAAAATRAHSGEVGLALAVAVLVGIATLALMLPVVADGQSWPRRVRLIRAAHLIELATEGAVARTVLEGHIIAVDDAGELPQLVPRRSDGRPERVVLPASTPALDIRRLHHWRAELIPVLIVGDGQRVDIHGPSGVVPAGRPLAAEAANR